MLKRLERYFEFTHLGTNWRTEILAGVTTFLTMAYIVLVNPAILAAAGVPLAAVTAATCLSAAFGSILMGVVARYPIALAPGMGLNAYFTYTVCLKMHIPWQTALGAVFLSGIIFLALTAAGIRQMILRSIPHELYAAVASGIGLFIAFIGFRNAGLVVGDPATLVGWATSATPPPALALFGLILMVALEVRKVRGSILIGVLTITGIAWALGLVHWTPAAGGFHALAATAFKLDIRGALNKGLLEIIFVFFFVDLFDNLGTLVAVTKRAGLIAADHSIPRLNRILFADATATVFGSLTGTSTVTSYVESTAGVAGRRPLRRHRHRHRPALSRRHRRRALRRHRSPRRHRARAHPRRLLMLATITEIRWHDPLVAVPAFLTLVLIPLTYSIANGLGFGIIAWAVLHLATGKFRKQDWLLYILAALFLLRFIYLGAS